jgi:hypothetical protein
MRMKSDMLAKIDMQVLQIDIKLVRKVNVFKVIVKLQQDYFFIDI